MFNKIGKNNKSGKKKKSGGTLIELLIFISLLIIILKLTTVWVISVYKPAVEKSRTMNHIAALQAGITFLQRDLLSAPSSIKKWKKRDATELIWSKTITKVDTQAYIDKNIDIGWSYKEGKLIRTEGYFDLKTERWKKAHRSLISCQLTTCAFRPVQVNKKMINSIEAVICGIEVEVVLDSYILKQKVCLRNRTLNHEILMD